MLTIHSEHISMPKSLFDFSLHEDNAQVKIGSFMAVLAEKINNNPTLEKVMFYHLFRDYVINDDVEFHYETKERFLKNFIFERRDGSIKRKLYNYVNPVQLSLYVPEFYETINEIFSGNDVPLPVFKKESSEPVQEKNKERFDNFWKILEPSITELEKNPSDNFATLLFVKWLKDGGDNLSIEPEHEGYFYTSFRQTDVLPNDFITISLAFPSKNESYDIKPFTEHPCKDMLVWKMLNSSPYPYSKKMHQHIVLNREFIQSLDKALGIQEVA